MIITDYFFLLFHFFLADISQLGIYSSSIRYVKASDAFEETRSFFELLLCRVSLVVAVRYRYLRGKVPEK